MAKAIMVQGTMSNAGKSLITAGLCRIFHQDGYRVAPFKSQNMALNSYITRQGDEIGRAQVMQAEAAGVEPSVLMNPVLLKPVSDSGSQVIVNGKVVGQMPAAEYYRYKPQLIPKIQEAYNSLAAQHDIIVLEGAGSPAEINLKQQDIVNMGMAKMAKAPVLLVGDIDRGGVFASLYGTLALLTSEEQSMVKGLIINKFRGDVGLLRPGLSMLEDLVHKPVVGVVPYARLDLDEEDSLAETLEQKAVPSLVEIAVIRLPHLSNFTDFSALNQIDGVGVRYISSAAELGEPDLIILPGTKNTIGDLLWLRSVGLEALILRMAGRGVPVIGICGGYQMLGQRISDPHHTEMGGDVRGMGLLPCTTVFEQEKVRTRVTGKIQPLQGLFQELSGADFEGYEIHMGHTQSDAPAATAITTLAGEATTEGAALGNVLGTYVHGFFDSPQVAAAIAKLLFETKGVDASQITVRSTREWKESQYNLLADLLRENLDMQAVYQILEEGI